MHGEPDRWFAGGGPLDPVPAMGWDVDERARPQFDRLPALESQAGRPLQQKDPFVALLVVPESLGRGVAQRDDPLDADARRPCRYPDAEPGGGPRYPKGNAVA